MNLLGGMLATPSIVGARSTFRVQASLMVPLRSLDDEGDTHRFLERVPLFGQPVLTVHIAVVGGEDQDRRKNCW
jgi:hypothetical protein